MIFSVQRGQLFQQRGGGGLFAPRRAFLLIVNGHRLRSAVLVLRQGEQPAMVANHFAIQRQRPWQRASLAQEPFVQERGKGFGAHAGEHPDRTPRNRERS